MGPSRIRRVYARRDATKGDRYAFYQADVRLQAAERDWALATFFRRELGGRLGGRRFLDVGCGTGSFLQTLVSWGADPSRLVGTELLPDRLELAQRRCASGIRWHLGALQDLPAGPPFEIVSASTVFSSLLAPEREGLASEMWRQVRPGGWVLLFDMRFDNPRNPDVRKVEPSAAKSWWRGEREYFRTLCLPPPIARLVAPRSRLTALLLSRLLPPLRSHYLLAIQKAADQPNPERASAN